MADTKISGLTALTGANTASGDLLTIVDVSDTTMAASGTNKKITLTELQSAPVSAGTANGVAYLNGSKVATSGSALQFDGTILTNETGSGVYQSRDNATLKAYAGSTNGTVVDINSAGTVGVTKFSINNSEQMRLTSTGLVIGSTTSLGKLSVWSAANGDILAGFRCAGTGTQRGLYIFGDNSTGVVKLDVTGSAGGTLAFATGGNETARIDTSGNLGLGVTPSAWGVGSQALQNGGGAFFQYNNDRVFIGQNNYIDGSFGDKYISSNYATRYRQYAGTHAWFTAPSGTAGNAITFTQAMTLDASGNLLLGTTTNLSSSFRASIEGGRLGVASASNAYALYLRYNNTTSGFYIGSPSADTLSFSNNAGNEVARIDSDGNLLVGTTSTNPTNGFVANQNGGNGFYVQIGHPTGTGTGVAYTRYMYNQTEIGSVTQSGTTAVLYNTTSDQRLKENIADADSASALIDSLQVRKFDWKADGTHQRYGFVAQELVTVAPEAVHQPADPEEMMAVDYSKLVPMLVAELQSLRARVAALES